MGLKENEELMDPRGLPCPEGEGKEGIGGKANALDGGGVCAIVVRVQDASRAIETEQVTVPS